MGKKLLIVILTIAILIVAFSIVFLVFIEQKGEKQNIEKPDLTNMTNNNSSALVLKEEYFDYILNEIGAYNLHNPPLSSEKPIIKFDIEGEFFTSEIAENKITTKKGDFGQEDLLFTITKTEIINAITSDDMKGYFVESVKSGKISIEIKTDKKQLFLKGYLSLYKELTGSEISPDQIE